ncbi:MAG: tetratricopeptide repeat protein [Phormidesmis sp.]
MTPSQRYERACLLAEQKRYQLAIEEALALLAASPNSDLAYNILSFSQVRQQQCPEAIRSAKQEIALAPNDSFHHYRLADALFLSEQYEAASKAITTAFQLNPQEPSYYALASAIYHDWGQLPSALDFAKQGLKIDPDHAGCLRVYIMGLADTEQWDVAEKAVARSLQLFPDLAFSHAAHGWLSVHQGKNAPAKESFKAALQLDPNSDWARRGMLEAIKSQNLFYRIILQYELWQRKFQRSKPGLFWAFWLAIPQLRAVYWLIVGITILIRYLFDIALRFHPYGCLLFTQKEKWLNNCGTFTLVLLILGGVATAQSESANFVLMGGLLGGAAYASCLSWFAQKWERRAL